MYPRSQRTSKGGQNLDMSISWHWTPNPYIDIVVPGKGIDRINLCKSNVILYNLHKLHDEIYTRVEIHLVST